MKRQRQQAHRDAQRERVTHAVRPAEAREQPAAEERAEHHRHAADHGLHADAHRVPMALQRRGDDGKCRGQRQRAPREKQKRAEQQRQPALPDQNQNVTGDGNRAEQQQRFSLPPMVGQPAAGIGVNRAEKSLQRVKKADDQNAAAERLNVFGREAEPEFFARAGEHERDEQQRGVAPQREEFGNFFPAGHDVILSASRAESTAGTYMQQNIIDTIAEVQIILYSINAADFKFDFITEAIRNLFGYLPEEIY